MSRYFSISLWNADKNKDEEESWDTMFKYKWGVDRWAGLQLLPDDLENPVAMFVYGTLRKADPRAVAQIYGKLYDMGVAVADEVDDPDAGIICGEVWFCEEEYMLDVLDRYEGYPNSYGREKATTIWPEEIECWVYTCGPWRKTRMEKDLLLPSPACWRESFYWQELEQAEERLGISE